MKEDKDEDADVNKRLSKHSFFDPDHQEKKFCKSVIINDDCKFYSQTTKINKQLCVRFEEENERCQSPYSISLSPNLVSKLTKRPPLPCPKNKQLSSKTCESDSLQNKQIIRRNDTKILSENQGKLESPEFFKYPEQKECKLSLQNVFCNAEAREENIKTESVNSKIDHEMPKNAAANSHFLSPNSSLPYPVFVSDNVQVKMTPHSSELNRGELVFYFKACDWSVFSNLEFSLVDH